MASRVVASAGLTRDSHRKTRCGDGGRWNGRRRDIRQVGGGRGSGDRVMELSHPLFLLRTVIGRREMDTVSRGSVLKFA